MRPTIALRFRQDRANPARRLGAELLGLAVAGAVRRRPPPELLTVVLYTWALHALVIADVRFALPVMPYVCVMAAAAFRYEDKRLA